MRLALAVLLVLLATAPAHAQDGGATVARNADVTLVVKDDRGERNSLCVDVRVGRNGVSGTCGAAPTTRMSAQMVSATGGTRTFVGGAVPAGTAEIELEFARGERVRARTVAGEAYRGRHAGKVAFFLAETTGSQRRDTGEDSEGGFDDGDQPVLIRRFDAAGTLIGASGSEGFESAPIAGPQTLLRSRRLRVTATAQRVFAPSVLQLDRTETMVCLFAHREKDQGGGGGPCTSSGPAPPTLELTPQRECSRGLLVYGFAAPDVATVELVLGDGRRKRARTIDVGALGATARAVAIVVPPGRAVRTARALDANGTVVHTEAVEAAPAARRCGDGLHGIFAFGSHDVARSGSAEPGEIVAGTAPGPQLAARDEGDHLCIGIDGFTPGAHDCVVPAPEMEVPLPISRTTKAYSAAAGLVPAGASAVRIVFSGGRSVAAEISDGGAYSGRYRGHVRFFLAQTGPGRTVAAVETYDARGRLLSSLPWEQGTGGPLRTVTRGRGYRVFGSRYDVRFKFPGQRERRSRGTCFGVAFGRQAPDPYGCANLGYGFVTGAVSCAPRRGVLLGRMTPGLLGARFELAGGGRVDSRVVRVPRRLGGGRLWVLEIPPRAQVKRLRMLGRLPSRRFGPGTERVRPYPLPAPRRQCGYGLDVTF